MPTPSICMYSPYSVDVSNSQTLDPQTLNLEFQTLKTPGFKPLTTKVLRPMPNFASLAYNFKQEAADTGIPEENVSTRVEGLGFRALGFRGLGV